MANVAELVQKKVLAIGTFRALVPMSGHALAAIQPGALSRPFALFTIMSFSLSGFPHPLGKIRSAGSYSALIGTSLHCIAVSLERLPYLNSVIS